MKKSQSLIAMLLVLFAVLFASPRESRANAISITNVSIAAVSNGTADIQFDISWSNSWNLAWSDDGGTTTVTNWDAAWVFLKFKTPSSSWRHGMLSTTGHTATGGTSIELGSNGSGTNVGAFIRRTTQGAGGLVAQGVKLRWDFAQSSLGGTTDVDVSIHAIEMVYIPRGAFALGSGGDENNHFYKWPTQTDPYYVTNEMAISSGTSAGKLYAVNGYASYVSNDFPKGYAPFYCMKYEISQGQYAAFLSHLDSDDADVRYPAYSGTYRYTIAVLSNQYVASAPDRACNYLSVQDLCSYLDWSGLRPMTELEFEKACRGTINPEPNEFVWGTTTIIGLSSIVGVDGSGYETALPASANCHSSSVSNGPVRVGIFAQPGASRQKSGAGYYGVMDLAGNVSECVVYSAGSAYFPAHGDGSIDSAPNGWPTFEGFMRRGMAWSGSTSEARTSSRDPTSSISRNSAYGGRGVRTSVP